MSGAYRAARTPRRRGRPVLAIGLIVLVAVILGFLLGAVYRAITGTGDGASPTPSASASAPASPGASPSASAPASGAASAAAGPAPSPVMAAPVGVIPPGSAVRVLVDGLRLRESPSTDAAVAAELPVGQILVIGFAPMVADFGPVTGSGLPWHPAIVFDGAELPPLTDGTLQPFGAHGWVATGDGTQAFVELVAPRCPARPVTLAVAEAMVPWEHLACFGAEQLTLEGTFGCSGCGGQFNGTFEPPWLTMPLQANLLSTDVTTRLGPLEVRIPPNGPAPPAAGSIVRVTGHFDDPGAAGCTIAPGDPPVPLEPLAAELYCREQLVVESFEVLGTDPNFPPAP